MRDAGLHGATVRPVDVNASRWDCTLEPIRGGERHAVRLGLRLVRGLANKDAAAIIAGRADKPFRDIDESGRGAAVPIAALERLADADALRPSLGLARRDAVWAIRALRDQPLPLFEAAETRAGTPIAEVLEAAVMLRPRKAGREVVEDYAALGLTLRSHPVSFLRPELAARGIVACAEAFAMRDGRRLMTAGLVLVRQRPGSAQGVLFITIEDETGIANTVVWPDLFERQRRVILSAGMIAVAGRVQREDTAPPEGRGDRVKQVGNPSPSKTLGRKSRNADIPDVGRRSGIKLRTRDFR